MPRLNIIVCLFLAVTVLAFPVRLFYLPSSLFYILSIGKGILFSGILFTIARRNVLKGRLKQLTSFSFSKIVFPAVALLIIYLGVSFANHKFGSIGIGECILLLLLTFTGVFAEEFAFRFFIPVNLIWLRLPVHKVILISSGLFALIHSVNFFKFENDIYGTINQVIFAFFMGILLASLFFITRSILFTTLYHFFVNLPAAFNKVRMENIPASQSSTDQSFIDNITGCVLFALFMSPAIFISLFYLNKIKGDQQINGKNIPGNKCCSE